MLHTINFRKVTYTNTNLLYYLSFNGDAMKFTWYFFNFALFLTSVAFLNKFFDIVFDIVSRKIYLKSFVSLNPFHSAKPLF